LFRQNCPVFPQLTGLVRACGVILTAAMALHAAQLDLSRLPAAAGRAVDFGKEVQPLFSHHCHKCHGPEKQKGDLRLDRKADALKGGEHGAAIVPGRSAESPLIHHVAGLIEDSVMPPKGDRLSAAEIGVLRAWIDAGAPWPDDTNAPAKTWWSLAPLRRPDVPKAGTAHPIDVFINAKLAEKKLQAAPPADPRTLIRRVTFDLTGLPPTPEEVEAFIRECSAASPEARQRAVEKLVDRLLASPRHGERWARHWLDVVHFGETHGYDKDKPRPNAWPYRDYVIRAFNEDKPFARFVQEQIAGDVLFPGTRDGIEALGFIAAGPWDLIGHEEVPETKIDGKIARHLDRDDMVMNTIQTFNSVTIQCAQCHNHKFDPISQEDYYSLQAVFAALDRTNRKYDTNPAVAAQRAALEERRAKAESARQELDDAVSARAGTRLKELDERISALAKPQPGKSSKADAFGWHSKIEKSAAVAKWVQVDLGQPRVLRQVVLHPCKDDFNNIGEGFGFPVRFKIELSDDAKFEAGVTVIADETKADFPNPKIRPVAYSANGQSARFIRVTATKLALRQNDYIFSLAELDALDVPGTNVALSARVTSLDSIEAPPRWRRENLTDGYFPGAGLGDPAELVRLRDERKRLLDAATTDAQRLARAGLENELQSVTNELARLPAQGVCYVGAVHRGSGAFAGTGASGGKPRPVFVLSRGNVLKPGREAVPGALSCVDGLPARFNLKTNASEGERRAELARWLTSPDNPLTWRSIVNRVWQQHFGRGLVETPNDFGRMGAEPSHPELLDWLACEFRDGGGSLKALHRLILTSAAWQRGSVISESVISNQPGSTPSKKAAPLITDSPFTDYFTKDSDNRWLARQNRRKLDAEEVRDTMLRVAGRLDLTMGGPSFQDFVVEKPEHSPHYQYHLHDPDDPATHRRSIYRFIVRSQQQPFMTTLDCADPSMQVGRRNESVSPLQALTLLNNALVITMSKHFAAKLERAGGDLRTKVKRAHEEALGRPPTAKELEALTTYAREHGLENFCRVLFNLNEFVFVD
jgi:mono/diheme cytochrome c family protein